MVIWMQCSQHCLRNTARVGAGSGHQENRFFTSKISGGKSLLVLVTSKGKGAQDLLHPLEGLQHLNRSREGGMFLGRERGRPGEAHLQSVMGKGQERHDVVLPVLQSLLGGQRHALPIAVSGVRWEEKTRGKGFWGHSPLLLRDC